MTHTAIQVVIAAIISLGIMSVACWLYMRDRTEHPDPNLPDLAMRREQYRKLLSDTPKTPFDDSGAPDGEPKAALLFDFGFPLAQPRNDITCSAKYAGSRIIGLECKQ
jgi:hypothetical protein